MNNFDSDPKSSEAPLPKVTKKERKAATLAEQIQSFKPVVLERYAMPPFRDPPATLPKKAGSPFFTCLAKGVGDIECEGIRCVAHVITRQDHALSAKTDNKIIVCKAHEIWFNKRDVKIWYRWVRDNYPAKFEAAKRRYRFVIKEYETFMEVTREDLPSAFKEEQIETKSLDSCTCKCHPGYNSVLAYCLRCAWWHSAARKRM